MKMTRFRVLGILLTLFCDYVIGNGSFANSRLRCTHTVTVSGAFDQYRCEAGYREYSGFSL